MLAVEDGVIDVILANQVQLFLDIDEKDLTEQVEIYNWRHPDQVESTEWRQVDFTEDMAASYFRSNYEKITIDKF
jgi:hypothetical protein